MRGIFVFIEYFLCSNSHCERSEAISLTQMSQGFSTTNCFNVRKGVALSKT